MVPYRHVAASLVTTPSTAWVVPTGSVPVGVGEVIWGGTTSGASGVIGVAMSVWISPAVKARA